ncbi:MAG: MlaE family lipid ABC transporter permease subunit [Dongiaceae bacterium]
MTIAADGGQLRVAARGSWITPLLGRVGTELDRIEPRGATRGVFDLGAVDRMDTAGAWLIERTRARLADAGGDFSLAGVQPDHQRLLDRVKEAGKPEPLPEPPHHTLLDVVARLGKGTIGAFERGIELLNFLGAVVIAMVRVLLRPRRIRFTSFVSHIEQVGLDAMPIVGLITFLVGVVLAYQGVDQLRRFGAEVFMVDLVAVSALREMGILLTAIMVAGRSGSAFTAQIGTMQVNEEVDAMRTMGLDPIEVLVLPRVMALVVSVPLLTFFANMMALIGGGLMGYLLIDISPAQFASQVREAVSMWTFWVGIIKAPVFAFIIGMVGCFEGLKVQGSAESVGRLTTQSVVESIFLVIVFDALFSILFSYIGI